MSDNETSYTPIEDIVDQLVDRKEFYTITWDHNLGRLQAKIPYFLLKGYKPVGNPFVQTEYKNIGDDRNVIMQPFRDKVGIQLFNEAIFNEVKEGEV